MEEVSPELSKQQLEAETETRCSQPPSDVAAAGAYGSEKREDHQVADETFSQPEDDMAAKDGQKELQAEGEKHPQQQIPEPNFEYNQDNACQPSDKYPDQPKSSETENPSSFLEAKKPANEMPTPTFVYILAALATIGGFLFGYDIGIVAGSMLFIQPYFELSTFWQEAVVSGTVGAAAVAALMAGWLTDRIGRKPTVMLSSVVFTVGGILMGTAPTKETLLLGRIVAGLGVGLASVVVPVYVAEASPPHNRGRLVSLHQLLINTGIIVSSLLAGGFSYVVPNGWRFMLGFAAVPGVVQFFGFLFMPESPRWLVGKGKMEEARTVLLRMRGGADVEEELEEIRVTVLEAEKDSAEGVQHILKILRSRHVRRAMLVGCGLLFFQQWCGINTVIYYSGSVLKMAGFPVKYAIWLVTVPNLINFLSSFIGLYLVEKIGRRQLLIGSLAGTIVGLVILAVGFQLSASNPATLSPAIVEIDGDGNIITDCFSQYSSCEACVKDNSCGYCYSSQSDGSCLPSDNAVSSSVGRCNQSSSTELYFKWAYEFCPSDYTWIALCGMAVFVFAFAPGLGPMPWTINSEIYPLWARSTCNSVAACTAWVCNLIISFTFLTMTETVTIHGTFWLFAGITVVGVIFMVFLLPETKDKTLEEVEQLFMNKQELEDLASSRNPQQTKS
ncbi:proton myo-inositol cotransporter [Plakobranchus ocellatus]|uniref:Proton myo-inositol cotransporter n=1 Tax=Plakobranchus ocellatus TaxID=259542 RepID=A0AAV4C972_9GAST|nr:proton myo-inositol cotransporter [Plakobranchus ocellatus]